MRVMQGSGAMFVPVFFHETSLPRVNCLMNLYKIGTQGDIMMKCNVTCNGRNVDPGIENKDIR